MKCEKQSEKHQATDTQRLWIQLCQWQIIFWPLSLSLYGWRFATVTACFCLCALYNFVTAGDPALKCWGARLFERQLDFLCCSFSFTLYLLMLCTVSLCQCNILIIYLSFSLLPLLFSVLFFIFCSVLLVLSLYHLYFHQAFSKRPGPGPNQHFCSGWCLRSEVQRPAWGEFFPHSHIHKH